MGNKIVVYKGRTTIVTASIGMDVSLDTITSEIRTQKDVESDLIATWDVDFASDGTDGELVLTLDNVITGAIDEENGFMDMKRLTGTEPVSVFDSPLYVEFRDIVTA